MKWLSALDHKGSLRRDVWLKSRKTHLNSAACREIIEVGVGWKSTIRGNRETGFSTRSHYLPKVMAYSQESPSGLSDFHNLTNQVLIHFSSSSLGF